MAAGNLLRFACVILLSGCAMAGTISPRVKRGASVYPVFPSGPNTHSPYSSNDPSVFIQYLGGSGGISNRRSGGQASASSHYGVSVPASGSPYTPQSASTSHAFDSNILNAYSLSSHSGSATTPATSSSGWAPSSSYGYSGSFYTTDFGHLTPNFSSYTAPAQSSARPHTPSLSANSLLHSAQTSFQSQNHLYDVLLTNVPRPQPYKG